MHAYVCMIVYIKGKEHSTGVKNIGNWPIEYTHNNTGLGTSKILPQEYLIRLLKGPNQTIAGRSAQTVNNLPAYICMDRGEWAEHWRKHCRASTRRVHTQWYMYWNGQYTTTRILNTPPQRSQSNYGWKVGSDSQQYARICMYDSRQRSGAPTTKT